LGITLNATVVEETLAAESKLMDGTRIFTDADAFVVGSAVQIETAEGMMPAPMGEHTLEDGNIIIVDEAGVITEIKTPEAEEEEAPEAPVEEEMAEEDKDKPYSMTKEKEDEIMSRLEKLEEVLLASVEALSKTNKELVEKVETLSAAPGAAPVKTRKPVKEENALVGLKLPKRN
jgi:hypothetical protein